MSDIQLASGLTAFQAGEFQKAAKSFHAVLKQKPRHTQALHLMGLSCAQMGEWVTALDYLRQAANTATADGEIWRNFAIIAIEANNETLAKQALAGCCRYSPKDAETARLLGEMAAARNMPAVAIQAWQAYLSLDPNNADQWLNLGTQYAALREHEKALQAFGKAAELAPRQSAPHANIGMLLLELKQFQEAEVALIQALDRQPDLLEAMKALGNCFVGQKRHDRALAMFRRVATLASDPATALQARQAMRTAMVALKRVDDALADLLQEPTANRDEAEFLLERARLMIMKDEYDAALEDLTALERLPGKSRRISCAHRILMLSLSIKIHGPDGIRSAMSALESILDQADEADDVWLALGGGAIALGNFAYARSCFDNALAITPNHTQALSSIGTLLMRHAKYREAEEYFNKAISADKTNAIAYNNMASCQAYQGRIDDAIASLSMAIETDSEYWVAGSNRLFFSHLSDNYNQSEIFLMATEWNERFIPKKDIPRPTILDNSPRKRLNVGFISNDFRRHAVSFFFESILKHRNRDEWNIILYSNTESRDEVSDRLSANADGWIDCHSLNDKKLADAIRNDGIDILIDLSGHTAGNRLPMFALRPAPIQATWLGYFDTTGMNCIDYLIADPISVTSDMESYFTETVLRMPHDFVCYQPPEIAPEVGSLPALTKQHITFGSANQLGKLTDRVVATWTALLHRLPTARLILQTINMEDKAVRQQVLERFAAAGMPISRLELRGGAQQRQIFELYRDDIDIALDPFPCVGGTTTCEALWMGVPVITLLGDRFCGRHSATHMTAVGLTETIAHTTDEYLDIAVRMASDLPALAELRANLRPRMAASPLVDAARFTADFEALLRRMWLERTGPLKQG